MSQRMLLSTKSLDMILPVFSRGTKDVLRDDVDKIIHRLLDEKEHRNMTIFQDEIAKRNDRLTFRGNLLQGRHGWLRLTPAYSIQVVEEIIRNHPNAKRVLDPFSGTGTTPLVAMSKGCVAHAVDVNPFLVWLGNLKLSLFEPGTGLELRKAAQQIVIQLLDKNDTSRSWHPEIHQIEKWWDEDVLITLSSIYDCISRQKKQQIADLLKVAFCRVMIANAHVSFGHQSMSFKSKSRNLFDDSLNPGDELQEEFFQAVTSVSETLVLDFKHTESKIFQGDSRNLHEILPENQYDLVVTSPPYPNRMSYIRELRPYMYWLGFLNSGREAGELDWNAMGGTWGCATSMLGKWQPSPSHEIPYRGFLQILNEIRNNNGILANYVHRYFEDMVVHIQSLKKVLSQNATCYYVVGNSVFYGVLLPVEEIFHAIFVSEGFSEVRIERIRKRNSKKELFEFVVIAKK